MKENIINKYGIVLTTKSINEHFKHQDILRNRNKNFHKIMKEWNKLKKM